MTALFWLVFALVAAAWGAAESIFARQVARMCRDKSLNRWGKSGLVAAGKMPAPQVTIATYTILRALHGKFSPKR